MRKLIQLAAAVSISILFYIVTYWVVLDYPLRFAYLDAVFGAKVRYAASVTDQRKLVVISGSNTLFGVSCARIEEETGVPCVNGGTANTFDLFFTVDMFRPYLRRGDVLYLPIDYNFYIEHTSPAFVGREALNYVMRDQEKLGDLTMRRALSALFYLDLPMALRAIGQMTQPARLADSVGAGTYVTLQGDMLFNTTARSEHFRWRVDNSRSYVPRFNREFRSMDNDFGQRLGAFLDWCEARGIRVIGGLPIFFDDTRVSDEAVERLRRFFAQHGAEFLVLENRSQYPRHLFYDREGHMNEAGRREHTRRLIEGLRRMDALPARQN